ncbi:D-alanyl-D-alanine carboxypeptidase [Candidatus Uhrbacteria bacterium]|nr:D-alanyl-D-alanine carboxypeptidase [Candidatus Uhrbacteria bacterium]
MKKIIPQLAISLLVGLMLLLISPVSAHAKVSPSLNKLSGLVLIQTQSYGRAWYVSPLNEARYYLKDKDTAYEIFKKSARIVDSKEIITKNSSILKKYKGLILTSQHSDTLTYIHPRTFVSYDMRNADQAFEVVKKIGIGATDALLSKIPMNTEQILPDTVYHDVAYAKYNGSTIVGEKDSHTLLPLASLTKLASALVLLDLNPDWNSRITISKAAINYPKQFVGNDQTSEVPIREGMEISFGDLWKAMLVASSNQATSALATSTGLSSEQFVARMNAKAMQLGLTKTRFFDCAGLDAHNTSTAKEMAILAYTAFQNEQISEGTRGEQFYITTYRPDGTAKKLPVANRNYSLLQFKPDASKTGFLVEAQRNVALSKNGSTIVVLHARSMRERNAIIKKLL